ncbi:flavodoxin domain-containing protein [Brevibacillus laterosporus]|uniref:flavodoxin domain-containing protein n=1 Tax=Brevibacillus laterosporus TaxID=1465 RepID=UPI0019563090|nr:flavodoxin domain-containing protein [Brevibacillus laterosporus]MBM7109731.1 Flavodoxin domain protein [Brevibacillus laterosporus]
MSNKIIVYATRYGASKEYALRIAKRKDFAIFPYKEIPKSAHYDEIILVAPIYAGKIFGLKNIIKETNNAEKKKITIITVGVYNPNRDDNNLQIRNLVYNMLEKSMLELKMIHHLYGKLEIEKLSFVHKLLIQTLYRKAKKSSLEQLSENEKDIIKAIEQKRELDYYQLDKILESL